MKRLEAHLFSAETKIQPFVEQKVQEWVHCVEKLTKASESQPQAAQMALTKSLQFEWAYLQRVVPNCADDWTHTSITFFSVAQKLIQPVTFLKLLP